MTRPETNTEVDNSRFLEWRELFTKYRNEGRLSESDRKRFLELTDFVERYVKPKN